MKQFIIAIIGLTIIFSCKNDKQTTNDTSEVTENKVVSKKYKLTPFTPSTAYPDAKLANMQYIDGKFSFDVTGTAYKLGMQTPDAGAKMCANSAKGQHIHLIVDDNPYSAQYVNNFDFDVADGDHTVLAFLSRSYHESIKTADAHILKKISVKDKSITNTADITEPRVTYSRPKGTYVGKDTEKIMLDYYISNASLGDGYTLEATINGETHVLDTWQPMYVEGFPMGENKVTLTLKKGDVIQNQMTRIFTCKADPAPEK